MRHCNPLLNWVTNMTNIPETIMLIPPQQMYLRKLNLTKQNSGLTSTYYMQP